MIALTPKERSTTGSGAAHGRSSDLTYILVPITYFAKPPTPADSAVLCVSDTAPARASFYLTVIASARYTVRYRRRALSPQRAYARHVF